MRRPITGKEKRRVGEVIGLPTRCAYLPSPDPGMIKSNDDGGGGGGGGDGSIAGIKIEK